MKLISCNSLAKKKHSILSVDRNWGSSGSSLGLSILCSAQHHKRLCCSRCVSHVMTLGFPRDGRWGSTDSHCARHRGSVLHGANYLFHLVLLDCEDGGSEWLPASANQSWHGGIYIGHLAMLAMLAMFLKSSEHIWTLRGAPCVSAIALLSSPTDHGCSSKKTCYPRLTMTPFFSVLLLTHGKLQTQNVSPTSPPKGGYWTQDGTVDQGWSRLLAR